MRALAGLLFFEAWDVTGPVVAAHTARSIPVELVVLAAGAQPISPFPRCHDQIPQVPRSLEVKHLVLNLSPVSYTHLTLPTMLMV